MRITDYRGKWCVIARNGGERRRISLGLDATDANRPAAERAARDLERQLASPIGEYCEAIFSAYVKDREASERKLIDKERLLYAWKALGGHFGHLRPDQVTRDACRRYAEKRRVEGRQDGTIRKELTVLRAALRWHDKNTPSIVEMPPPPPPRDRWLSKEEFAMLLKAAQETFHLTVFLHLAIATAGRKEALLTMTWPQVRWDRNEIWLGIKQNGKRRATVPMTQTVRAVLQQARRVALTEYVIEFEGMPIKSIRRSFEAAVRRARLKDVHIHDLRHTAAVWMAAAGVSMEKIREFMGHSDIRVTANIYARFAPEHLRSAADALEVGQCSVVQLNHPAVNKR